MFPLLLLLMFIARMAYVCSVCPAGYNRQFECSCYRIQTSFKVSLSYANVVCNSDSAHLVYIESQDEKEAIAQWYGSGDDTLWIGLTGFSLGTLQWGDGSSVTYTSFDPDFSPFSTGSGCYRLVPPGYNTKQDTWHDHYCSYSRSFICEYEDPDPACSSALLANANALLDFGCPTGFDVTFGCSCYDIRPTSWTTRQESQNLCEAQSGHLVFIESAEEKDFLAATYNRNFVYWIGANGRQFETKTWDDGTVINFDVFGTVSYTWNDDSGCYRIIPESDGFALDDEWHDWGCTVECGYICEYETACSQETTAKTTTKQPTTKPATTKPPTTFGPTTLQPTTHQETTKPPTTLEPTTLQPTTHQPSTPQPSTLPVTTTRPFATTEPSIITTKDVSTTEEGVIDVGSFFGVSLFGIYIPGDSVKRSRDTVPSANRCGLLCPPITCRAFMYVGDLHICHLAVAPSTIVSMQIYSRLMRCNRKDNNLICS